jgi:hypothetical protein
MFLVPSISVTGVLLYMRKKRRREQVRQMIDKACDSKDKKMLERAIREGESVHLRQSDMSKARETLRRVTKKYVCQTAIFDALETGDTKLVKGTWLVGCTHMMRCQDLPDVDAVWDAERLKASYKRVEVVAISYCWVEPKHPDPSGEHLRIFQKVIELRLQSKGQLRVLDLAIFLDFLSMPQPERNPDEQASFLRALAQVNLWYAHQDTVVWLQTWVPDHVKNKYMQRGWPRFERAVAAMITDSDNCIDLAPNGQNAVLKSECEDWQSLWEGCRADRGPPILPDAFHKMLDTLFFTNGSDEKFVASKYKQTFHEVLGAARDLWFAELGWDDDDAKELAEVLKHCHSLEQLCLIGNEITIDGAMALVVASQMCLNLVGVDFTDNKIEDGEGAKEMRRLWVDRGKDGRNLITRSQACEHASTLHKPLACLLHVAEEKEDRPASRSGRLVMRAGRLAQRA